MIVLAESNLVLELAFQQEQSGAVESLVTLAETQQMELVILQVLTGAIIENAHGFESRFELDPHDAVVFASIEAALRERADGEKLFVNKNSRDFMTPEIEDHLERYGCKLITNFSDARQIVERAIQAARTRAMDRSTT
jgi:hypothetical protein